MAYSEKSAARLAALHGEIEARKEHEFAAPTYRDAAALAEIRQTVFNQLESEHEHDRDTVEDSIAVLRYLAESYENMGRTACALPLRKKVLELDAELAARFKNREGIESDYYCALKARNRYGRDECADLRELAAGLLPLDKQIQIEKNVFENYPMLVRDRVELSEEYLAVIDEVERPVCRGPEVEFDLRRPQRNSAGKSEAFERTRNSLAVRNAVESGSSVRLKSREPIRK